MENKRGGLWLMLLLAASAAAQDSLKNDFVMNPTGKTDQCLGVVKAQGTTDSEVKFETCNGGTGQLWNLIATGGKNQWQNKDTKTCLQAGEKFTLSLCSAAAVPGQTFTRNVLVAPKTEPILCGAPCDSDPTGLCGFDIAKVDWCGDTGAGFENEKVSIVSWCDSLAGQGHWSYSAATLCSKPCGGGYQTVAYQCISNNNFPNACCKTSDLPNVRQKCNSQPCGASDSDYKVIQSTEGLCLTASGETASRFRECNGLDIQQWIQIPGSGPDSKLWVNRASGNCLTNPQTFVSDNNQNFMRMQPCQKDLMYQSFAKNQLINTEIHSCLRQCESTVGACVIRDTDVGQAGKCDAGSSARPLKNVYISLIDWCSLPESAGSYVAVSQGTCSVPCGGGTQNVKYACKSSKVGVQACCKGVKPNSKADCNPQPCGLDGPRPTPTSSSPASTGKPSGSGSSSKPDTINTNGMAGSTPQGPLVGTNATVPGIVSPGTGNKPNIVVPQGPGPDVPNVSNPPVQNNDRPTS